jgi:hypothetical protein
LAGNVLEHVLSFQVYVSIRLPQGTSSAIPEICKYRAATKNCSTGNCNIVNIDLLQYVNIKKQLSQFDMYILQISLIQNDVKVKQAFLFVSWPNTHWSPLPIPDHNLDPGRCKMESRKGRIEAADTILKMAVQD